MLPNFKLYYKAIVIKQHESLKINPCIDSQLISVKKEPRIHNRERTVFSINDVGKIGHHMSKNETGPPYTKINSKCIKELNIQKKTNSKLLEINLSNDF